MIEALRHTWYMTLRDLRALLRQPAWIVVTLVQPLVWLLLFAPLFESITRIPGFVAGSYLEFLAPAVVVMTALFTAGWSGMSTIHDLERGVLDRFLVSPVWRVAIIAGRVGQTALVIAVQASIVIGLALAMGARFPSGIVGVPTLILLACLLGASFGAISNGLALLARREETLIAVMNFLLLPLTFLSSAFMQKDLMPAWMQRVAVVNPVNWAVEAGRVAVLGGGDPGFVLSRAALLVGLSALCATFATRAFRAYQRAV